MARVLGNCLVCRVPLRRETPEPLAGAELAAALCPACADALFLEGGGAILELRQELEGARFPLGKVTITGGAVAALADAGEHAATFLGRHVRGDWGEHGHCDAIQLTAEERRRGWEATKELGCPRVSLSVADGGSGAMRSRQPSGHSAEPSRLMTSCFTVLFEL